MSRVLVILEVSRKQEFIFSSRRLRENYSRSQLIRRVTESPFFAETAGELYREEDNLVYSGGGHTVVQFDSSERAAAFVRLVTERALREYGGLEIFAKQLPYDESKSPSENLRDLSAALEAKKSRRRGAFLWRSCGMEALDSETYQPCSLSPELPEVREELVAPPQGWTYPTQFSDLAGKDNFIAVVHIDGNAMGKRVQHLYEQNAGADWDRCRRSLRTFSDSVDGDFRAAFRETAEELAADGALLEAVGVKKQGLLPLRPVILAGDDVCFVTAGRIGLACAEAFLRHLSGKVNEEDHAAYAACAGVAMVHQKCPFHRAYRLAEELCESAKRFGAEIDPEGGVSAMDWHIEFGQLRESLAEHRADYETEDSRVPPLDEETEDSRVPPLDEKTPVPGTLELRPVTVLVPEKNPDGREIPPETVERITGGVRTWDFFRGMCRAMRGEYGRVARSKIKDLRTALKQGETEGRFFLQNGEVDDLLYHGFEHLHGENAVQEAYRQMQRDGHLEKETFREVDGVRRSLYFDAIEMIDHCDFFEEAGS